MITLKNKKILIALLLAFFSLSIFYLIVKSNVPLINKIVYSFIIFYLVSLYYKKAFGFESFYGILLLRSKKGLHVISSLSSKFKDLIMAFSDISYACLYGFLFFFFCDWLDMKRKIIAFVSAFVILLTTFFIMPIAFSYFIYFSDLPKSSVEKTQEANMLLFLVFIGGITLMMIYLLFLSSFNTLIGLFNKLIGQEVVVKPSVALVLPGINIPFFEGIIALLIILVTHEFAHAFAASVHRIKIKSSGIVSFGSLPIGAFVEVDEEKLFRSQKKIQVRTLANGIGANIITAVIFGLMFILFLFLTAKETLTGCYTNQEVKIIFDKAEKCIKIGPQSVLRLYENDVLQFLYNVFGLTISLSILVGFLNALPIIFFDGNHLLRASIGDNIVYKIISYLALISFFILILPAFL